LRARPSRASTHTCAQGNDAEITIAVQLFLVASVAVRVTGMTVAAMQRLDRLEDLLWRSSHRTQFGRYFNSQLATGKKSKVKSQNTKPTASHEEKINVFLNVLKKGCCTLGEEG
jgi:hypothetical protein